MCQDHIVFCRLSETFTEQIKSVIGWFADIKFALFPLQCFPLSKSRRFSVTFSIQLKQPFQGNSHSATHLLHVKYLGVTRFQMADGCRLENCRNGHIAVAT